MCHLRARTSFTKICKLSVIMNLPLLIDVVGQAHAMKIQLAMEMSDWPLWHQEKPCAGTIGGRQGCRNTKRCNRAEPELRRIRRIPPVLENDSRSLIAPVGDTTTGYSPGLLSQEDSRRRSQCGDADETPIVH